MQPERLAPPPPPGGHEGLTPGPRPEISPAPIGPEQAPPPERQESHEAQPSGLGAQQAGAPPVVIPPALPVALPPAEPPVAAPPAAGNVAAQNADVIEKEWVDRAKAIIKATSDDPHRKEYEVSKLQADYLEKRFGVRVKLPQE